MNYLRKIVSGKRRRFQDTQFDLDMTYITPRVIAMSFPASGMVETTYRNPISKVAKFLKERHGNKYWVFNCSERSYEKGPFDGQVSDFLWKDHHAPTLALLFAMVKSMYEFLQKDPKNVVVVHCNSGKGRTGTGIATLLLYTGFVNDMDDALKYYGWKRFSSGIGVSQPCQLRTIYYFEAAMKGYVKGPCAKRLKAIVFKTVPNIANDGCRPYFDITNSVDDHVIYTSRQEQVGGTQLPPKYYSSMSDHAMLFDFEDGKEPILCGDVHFIFKHRGVISDSQICRVAFNTAFIPANNTLILNKYTISPDKAKKDSRFNKEFVIQFVFEDYCSNCNKPWDMALDAYCEGCKELLKNDISNWRAIQLVVNARPQFAPEEGDLIHFHEQEGKTDKSAMLQYKLLFDSNNYKVYSPTTDMARIQADMEQQLFGNIDATARGTEVFEKSNAHKTYFEEESKQSKLRPQTVMLASTDIFEGFDYNNEHEEESGDQNNPALNSGILPIMKSTVSRGGGGEGPSRETTMVRLQGDQQK